MKMEKQGNLTSKYTGAFIFSGKKSKKQDSISHHLEISSTRKLRSNEKNTHPKTAKVGKEWKRFFRVLFGVKWTNGILVDQSRLIFKIWSQCSREIARILCNMGFCVGSPEYRKFCLLVKSTLPFQWSI